MPQTRVIIADSHPIIGQGLSTLLRDMPDVIVLDTALTVDSAESLSAELHPDVLILDADLGASNCARLVERLRLRSDAPAIILLSSEDGVDRAEQALDIGASGFILREASLEDLVAAIRWAHLGELWTSPSTVTTLMSAMQTRRGAFRESPLRQLTQREEEILELLVAGFDHKAIAEKLRLSLNTVRTHTRNIQMKLNVHSNIEAVSVALERGVRPS